MDTHARLVPYMESYATEFADDGNVNWLPYTMYFHPFDYQSKVVNTDSSGFRYSEKNGRKYAVTDHINMSDCNLIAGSSTVFGIGASSDAHTLASRLSENDPESEPWINFGGRSFNSTQEMILFSLYRHKLPKIKNVVVLSGFNDLGLARLPKRLRQDCGAFFMCRDFYAAMEKGKQSRFSKWFGTDNSTDLDDDVPSLEEQIDYAVGQTMRNLANWHAMCAQMGAPLTFVLQPLSNWVRTKGSEAEEALFAEREQLGGFAAQYGDILSTQTYTAYRDRLRAGAIAMGIPFVDLTEHIQDAIADDFWLFVDRIHFTDQGHDLVSRILLENVLNTGDLT